MKLRVVGYDQNNQEVDLTGKVTPMMNGNYIGERLVEEVMFNINLNEDRSDFTIEVNEQDEAYLSQLDKNYWYGMCRETIFSTDFDFDKAEISEEEAEKFGVDTDILIVNDEEY